MFFKSIHKFANGFLKADSLQKRLRHRKSHLVFEPLEDRLCLSSDPYTYSVVAATGSMVNNPSGASVGTLTNISLASINDSGNVAFLGTINGENTVDEGTFSNGSFTLTDLSSAIPSHIFTFPQIDNNGNVIAQDQVLSANYLYTYIRLWQPSGTYTTLQNGLSSNDDILVIPTTSPDETTAGLPLAYSYQDNSSGSLSLYIKQANGTFGFYALPAGSGGLRPMIADNGAVVVRDGSTTTSPISLFQLGQKPVTIAKSTDFSSLGNNPGIDAGGNVVTFVGDISNAADLNSANDTSISNAQDLNSNFSMTVNTLEPGPGIFASIPIDVKGDRVLVRLAGMSGSGFLNPGETWTNNTDVGVFSSFPDDRVVPTASLSFSNNTLNLPSLVSVAFVATDTSGNQGIYTNNVDISRGIATVDNPIEVVNSGETIAGVGPVTGVNDYFPVNAYGQIAFVATTSAGQDLVEATPYNYIAPQQPSQTAHPATLQSYTPDQILQAYGIDSIPDFTGQNGQPITPDGTGQTIAIVDAYNDPKILDDLVQFDQQFDVSAPPNFQIFNQDGVNITSLIGTNDPNVPPVDSTGNWEGEEALDVEWAHAIAPGANIILVEANSFLNSDYYPAVSWAENETGVSVVSMSFLEPEYPSETTDDQNIFTPPHGVTLVASSGDNGAPGQYPAFSPNVVAVGGTTLYLNPDDSYQSETGWGGSGGSASAYESQPSYQNGIVSQFSTTQRTSPDVSFDADIRTGVQTYNSFDPNANSFWGTDGGTSLSAPCWAGLIAIVDQGRVLSGKQPLTGPSQTLPALYQLPPADFNDITIGNNAQYTLYDTVADPSQFSAAPGYDMVTGLGSPVANLLVPDLVAYANKWTGEGSNNLWSNPANWSGNNAPLAGDDLLFPSGALQETSVNDLGFTFNSITTADTYRFSGQALTTSFLYVNQGSLELACAATVSNVATVAAGASLTVDAGNTLDIQAAMNVVATGSLTGQGTITVDSSASLTDQGTVMVAVGGTVTVASGGTLTDQGTVTVAFGGTLTDQGTVTVASGGNLDDQGTVTVATGGTLTDQGTVTVAFGGTVTVASGGTLTDQGTVTVAFGGNLDDQGTLTVEQLGTLDDQGSVTVEGTLDDFGVAANAVTVEGNATLGVSGALIVESNAFLDIKGKVEIDQGGSLNDQGTVTVEATGLLSDQDSITVAAGATLDVFGNLMEAVGGDLDVFGTSIIESGGDLDVFSTLIIEPGGVLDIFGTVTVEIGATYTPLGTVTVEPGGTLTILGQATPVITVSTSALDLGTTTQGTAGTPQSFTVSGSNLTADIVLTAPTGVELSDNGGTSYSTTLDLAESGGTVGVTTILARIAATAPLGPVSGTIAADSTGATEQDISVSGTVNPVPTPTITVSTSALDLGTTTQGTAGTPQSFTVSGSNLAADIVLTAPTGVELSDNGGTSYSTTLDLAESGGTVGVTTILARIAATAPLGPVSGTIAADSTGATEQDISVSGTVNPVPTPTITVSTSALDLGTTTQGTAGTPQSFTVSGTNLTADIVLTAPTGVELSDNGGTSYSTTLDLAESGGTVGVTTILARIAATAPLGPISGKIAADSTGATEQDITVSGTVNPVLTPTITVSTSALNLGTTTQGTAGTPQSFTVSGSNLTADIVLTAPTSVELSDNGGTSYSTTLDLAESGGTVGVTTILARIAATAPLGPVSGTIAADSTGATEQDISVSGTVNPVLTIIAISPVSPNPRNVAVLSLDVTFNEPINLGTFTDSALTLTDNGGPNLITSAVTVTSVSGSTYQIGGLAGLTTAEGQYTFTVNAADIQDPYGDPGTGTKSTSWLMDTAPPTSTVNALPTRESNLVFPVSVTGSDQGNPPSGVSSYDIYSSTNGGPWTFWTTVSASSPSANFTGQSNTTYSFYSIAHDLAGNTEIKSPTIEASTYVPDLTPPVTSVDGTTGTNPSTVNTSTGTFTLNLTGSDPGGSVLTYFEVFVSVDSGTYTMVNGTAIPAGPADSSGNVHATIPYQGLTDGAQHTYAFYSIGFDGAGNVQSAPATPNLTLTETFSQPSALQVTNLVVENGAAERSYIRYVDVGFNESDSQSGSALTQIVSSVGTPTPDFLLYKYDLAGDASSKTAVSLSGVSLAVIDHAIELDFGAKGIGGNPNTTAADGYYELDIMLPNGTTAVHHFYRLLGDVTGDGVVDNNDLNEIATEINLSSLPGMTPLNADVNGDGTVTAFDLTLATRSKGRKLGSGLSLG